MQRFGQQLAGHGSQKKLRTVLPSVEQVTDQLTFKTATISLIDEAGQASGITNKITE